MIGNKSNLPLLSIIMNCYNGEKYLKEAIDSVLAQSYTNWELIFWDNQSTDATSKIVKDYDEDRIFYHLAETKEPLSKARNLAIEKAKGDYIAFLDSDDIWFEHKLKSQMELLVADESSGISYTGFETLLTSESQSAISQAKFYSKFKYKSYNSRSIYKDLLKGNFIIFSTVIIKKNIFDLTRGFSEFLEQNEDYEILLKASLLTNAICVSEVLVKYRIHASNNSYLNIKKNFTENFYIFSTLPLSREISWAKDRNKLRENIYFISNEKKWEKVFTFLNPKYWQHIIYLVSKKVFKQ